MSQYDAELYEQFAKVVRRQVKSLRVILESLQVCITLKFFLQIHVHTPVLTL